MSTILTVVITAIVVILIAAAALAVQQMQQRKRLRAKFGPEYDRTVESRDSRREAERELRDREYRVKQMDLRPIDPAARDAYRAEWARIQERFVDSPKDALSDADQLIRRVMADRGYDVQDYGQRVADLSVEHGKTLEHYRTAHEISTANRPVSTEDNRKAMVHYRSIFDDLLESGEATAAQTGASDETKRTGDQR